MVSEFHFFLLDFQIWYYLSVMYGILKKKDFSINNTLSSIQDSIWKTQKWLSYFVMYIWLLASSIIFSGLKGPGT